MILISSSNEKILARWRAILQPEHSVRLAGDLSQLENELASRPTLVILHEALMTDDIVCHVQSMLKRFDGIKILVLSDKPNESTAFKLIHSGVYGYSNTYLSAHLLMEATRQILAGEVWMGKRLRRFLSTCLLQDINHQDGEIIDPDENEVLPLLTERERDVAQLIAMGHSNKSVAEKLDISERTVKAHLSSIFQKTGITNRMHLALILNSHKYD
jgi:DNA-binding NarL/FixJ family response regulator